MAARTDRFWNCDCSGHSLRSAKEYQCKVCGAIQDNQPYAFVEDVIPVLREELTLVNELIKYGIFDVSEMKRRDELEEFLSEMEVCYA